MNLPTPTFRDVLAAQNAIRPYLEPTPLRRYSGLDELLGCEVYVKHENHLPTCAFKVRGGVNLISRMRDEERRRGVIAASTGNHGQSVAYAARLFGVRAIIGVPEGANPGKVAAMQGLGADVRFLGRDFDEAREAVERLADEHGYRYIHSGDEPLLIAGVATHTLEILERQPDVAAIFVPVGGGSGAAGACIVAGAIDPAIEVVAVQSATARAAYESWRQGMAVECPSETFAEGLQTRNSFALPQRILRERLKRFELVSDDELRQAIRWLLEHAHTLSEGAGAAALAALHRDRERYAGRKVALILSGGNITVVQLHSILAGAVAGS
jgi:threonine dehydratase